MTERNPFEHKRALAGGGSLRCEDWEELLTDALDGQLPAAGREPFEAHAAACPVCAELLAQARQGQEWLRFLEDEPEAPTGMVARIIEKTSGAAAGLPLAAGGPIPVAPHVLGLPVRRVGWDARMMMTVAMAFFSIALTLNLVGIRLSEVRLVDLTPASLEAALTRGFYGAKGSLVRYYDNLRLVYEVESKMRDLRRSEQMRQAAPSRRQVPAKPQGNGHKNGGRLTPSARVPAGGELWGEPEVASVQRSEVSDQADRAQVGSAHRSAVSVQEGKLQDGEETAQVSGFALDSQGSDVREVMAVFWKVGQERGLA